MRQAAHASQRACTSAEERRNPTQEQGTFAAVALKDLLAAVSAGALLHLVPALPCPSTKASAPEPRIRRAEGREQRGESKKISNAVSCCLLARLRVLCGSGWLANEGVLLAAGE